jgi:hypothetical protein
MPPDSCLFHENFGNVFKRKILRDEQSKVINILQSALTIQENYQKVVHICKNSPYCVSTL